MNLAEKIEALHPLDRQAGRSIERAGYLAPDACTRGRPDA
jgi:hypothetical protein